MRKIAAQLHGERSLTWVVTAYLLASTVTIPVYGRLADCTDARARCSPA
ncbi:hypothetical protein [Amycolatopsis australiensis]|nr:hypothetical protein [Amycolatopsis australiensis]